jgi:N-sulfoglucosamine sulfohydrolase
LIFIKPFKMKPINHLNENLIIFIFLLSFLINNFCFSQTFKPPNILVAISDDQSYIHAGSYGYTQVRTPVFDSLAKEGILFTRVFSASPMCSVSRASLLTGRNPWQNGEAGQHNSLFPAELVTYTDILEEAGYFVGFTGKGWHPGNWQITGRKRDPAGYEYNKIGLQSKPAAGIYGKDYAENFKKFLSEKPKEQPFCFWYGAREPHAPYEKGSGIRAGYSTDSLKLTSNYTDTSYQQKSDVLDYFFEIEWFDTKFGEIINILKQAGHYENTLIVVTSDNGTPMPGGKGTLYDFGTHVPMIVLWPCKAIGGRIVEDLISFIDLAPTFLEVAGIEPLDGMSGRSIVNLLLDKKSGFLDPDRKFVVAGQEKSSHQRKDHLGYPMRSLRTKDYLYIRNFKPERWPAYEGDKALDAAKQSHWYERRPSEELYEVNNDFACLNNLAGESVYKNILNELRELLSNELQKQSDPRVLGYGDIFEGFPRYGVFDPELEGFNKRGEYNPEFLMDIPDEIFVSELYFKALLKK